MKKIIKDIIDVLGNTLIITGEVGLILYGLSYLWTDNKFNFFIVFIVVTIIKVIDKIKDKRGKNI